MYHAEGVVCPVTFPMHLAAAVPTKPEGPKNRACVVIAGGREPAHWEAYPHHQFISNNGALSCCANGGCWKSRCHALGDGDAKDRENLCEQPVAVQPDLCIPRCMHMITPEDVVRRIGIYYEGGALSFLSHATCSPIPAELATDKLPITLDASSPNNGATKKHGVDEIHPFPSLSSGEIAEVFRKGTPRGLPRNWANLDPIIEAHRLLLREASSGVSLFPTCFQGRGIVICAGGSRHFTNAWVCMRRLRHVGCKLPIQFWHLGEYELDMSMRELVAPFDVECVDAERLSALYPVRALNG